jgi:hypothetical protein
MTLPPLPIAATATGLDKQQQPPPPVSFDEEAKDIDRLAWVVHTGDVRGVRRMMSELGEYGRLDDVGSFALTAPTAHLHVTARWAQIDRQSGLSLLQLAMRELNRRPRSAAAAEIVALLTAEARVHHTAIRPKLMRALRRGGLQANSATIVGDFLDGGNKAEEGMKRAVHRAQLSWTCRKGSVVESIDCLPIVFSIVISVSHLNPLNEAT